MTLVKHFFNILLILVLIGSILANRQRFTQQNGVQVNVTNASSQEPTVINESQGDDSMMESLQDKLLRACVNPQFRNTPLGLKTCQNYTENTNQTEDLIPKNCSLGYWDCCSSSFQNNEGQDETIKTCIWINKCDAFYTVSTCVTPSTCNKTCNNNNSTLNLFNDSLRGNASKDIQALIQNNSNQGVLNLAQKDMVRNTQCVGSPIGKDEGLQTNCCTGCETQYYTLNGQLLLYYNIPDFNKTDLSPILLAANVSSTFHYTVLHDKYMYLFNTCQDPRVDNLFGINQNNQLRYQLMCRNLAYDWGQYFAPYQCNQWLCNNQGTCNFTTLPTGKVSPTCTCNNGFRGWNCMFNSTTYDYITGYMNGLDTWVNNFERILDEETLMAFMRIVNHIMNFVAYADPADRDKYAKTVDKYWSLVGSAEYVNITDDLLRGIGLFADSLFSTDSVVGLDPNATRAALSKFPNVSVDAPKYAYFTSKSNNQEPVTLGGQTTIHPVSPNISSNKESPDNQTNNNNTSTTPRGQEGPQNPPNPFNNVKVVNSSDGGVQSVGAQLPNNTNITIVSGQGGKLRRRFLTIRFMQDQQTSNNTTTIISQPGGANLNITTTPNEQQNITIVNNTPSGSATEAPSQSQPNATNQTPSGESVNSTEQQPNNQTAGGEKANATQQPNATNQTTGGEVGNATETQPNATNQTEGGQTGNATNQTAGGETGNATETQPNNQTIGGGTGNITQPLVNITVVNTTAPSNQTQPQEGNATQLGNETTNEPQGPIVSNQGGQGKINLLEGRSNPKVTIPANVTSQLPNNTVYALFVVRNPRTFLSPNDTFIYSQLVHVFAFPDYQSQEGVDTSNRTNNSLSIVPNTNNTNHTNPAASQQGGGRILQQTQNTTNETNNNTNDNNTAGQTGNQPADNNTEAAGNNTGGNTIANITIVNNTAAGTGENNTNQTTAQPAENNTAPAGNETAANNQNQTASPTSEGNNATQPMNETGGEGNNTNQNQNQTETGGQNVTQPTNQSIVNVTIVNNTNQSAPGINEEIPNNTTEQNQNNTAQTGENNTNLQPNTSQNLPPSHIIILLNTSSGTQDISNNFNSSIVIQTDPTIMGNQTIVLNGTSNTNITVVVEGSNISLFNGSNEGQISVRGGSQSASWDQIAYPSDAGNMTISIPWTYKPLIVNGSYDQNCKVYSYDGRRWNQENNCTVDSTSDKNQAVIICNRFGLFGVNCENVTSLTNNISTDNSTMSVASTGPGINTLRTVSPSSSNYSGSGYNFISVLILGILGVLLI